MTRKYNPGLYVGLVSQWQAESAMDDFIARVHERRVKERAQARTLAARLAKTEARYREAFCKAFDADMTRKEFYHELLFWFGLAVVCGSLFAGLAAALQ